MKEQVSDLASVEKEVEVDVISPECLGSGPQEMLLGLLQFKIARLSSLMCHASAEQRKYYQDQIAGMQEIARHITSHITDN